MKLLYKEEHLTCPNYDERKRPAVEVRNIQRGMTFDEHSKQYKIIFILEGKIKYAQQPLVEMSLKANQMMLISPEKWYKLSAQKQSKVLIIRLEQTTKLCECYLTESLMHQTEKLLKQDQIKSNHEPFLLEANTMIQIYTYGLVASLEKGLKCRYYFENKTKELFYLFRAFYPKEELAFFFKEMLSSDSNFFYFVQQNYRKYQTVGEFAAALNMTPQSFDRRFRAAFHIPPYTWMTQQKATHIYHAICTEETPLKELASRFGFASKSSFSDFCKKNLGDTPGVIRLNIHLGRNDEQKEKKA